MGVGFTEQYGCNITLVSSSQFMGNRMLDIYLDLRSDLNANVL